MTSLFLVILVCGLPRPSRLDSMWREAEIVSGPRLRLWTWRCINSDCIRSDSSDESIVELTAEAHLTLDGCKSVCGKFGALWPAPTKHVELAPSLVYLEDDFRTSFHGAINKETKNALGTSIDIFKGYLEKLKSRKLPNRWIMDNVSQSSVTKTFSLTISLRYASLHLGHSTNETYSLSVTSDFETASARIEAETFFGARHGLETLAQMVSYDPYTRKLQLVSSASVVDSPVYPHRGILIDTGRNFLPIPSIKRVIDGMSYNKLNVLHWHMNEQQSFPFVSERVPGLTEFGAYSPDELYFKSEIQDLTRYAKQRGVLLLPEFDAPAHAASGWDFGPRAGLGRLVTCFKQRWTDGKSSISYEPPPGQLNPVNENLYKILGDLYKDLLESFSMSEDLPLFHMGGDEVNFACWSQDPEIVKWLSSHHFHTDPSIDNSGYLELWGMFQKRARELLVAANAGKEPKDGTVLWTSELVRPHNIEKHVDKGSYVIQVWTNGDDPWLSSLLKMGYRVILSNTDAWYLDYGFGGWLFDERRVQQKYFSSWRTVYDNSPKRKVLAAGLEWAKVKHLVLGGEAAMWAEQVDEFNLEPRLWPRCSALAERLWAEPNPHSSQAERRLAQHRHRMVERGLNADSLQPEFCRQRDGWCYWVYVSPAAVSPIRLALVSIVGCVVLFGLRGRLCKQWWRKKRGRLC